MSSFIILGSIYSQAEEPSASNQRGQGQDGDNTGDAKGSCVVCAVPTCRCSFFVGCTVSCIPGSSRYVNFLPFCRFFGGKGTDFTHLEDPGIKIG